MIISSAKCDSFVYGAVLCIVVYACVYVGVGVGVCVLLVLKFIVTRLSLLSLLSVSRRMHLQSAPFVNRLPLSKLLYSSHAFAVENEKETKN